MRLLFQCQYVKIIFRYITLYGKLIQINRRENIYGNKIQINVKMYVFHAENLHFAPFFKAVLTKYEDKVYTFYAIHTGGICKKRFF